MPEELIVAGIDLGGTKIEACLVDVQRNILSRKRIDARPQAGLRETVDLAVGLVNSICTGRTIAALGLGTGGTYLPEEDRLAGLPHTPAYEEPGLIGLLRQRVSVPVTIENDANCLALAEYFHSYSNLYRHVLAIILGTGVGGGLILDGKLQRGALGGAGEIGHVTIRMEGRSCQCGRRGCIESYLSGPSISRRYLELSGFDEEVPSIYSHYLNGNQQAQRLFDESCRIMAEWLADLTNILDLEAIILGGGISNLPIWYQRIPQLLSPLLFGLPKRRVKLIKAKLGDSAGVIGAAFLALRSLGKMTF